MTQFIGWQLRSKSIPNELSTGEPPNYQQIKDDLESRLLAAIERDNATESRDILVVHMYLDGFSGPELARRFSLSRSQIYRILKKEGKKVLKSVHYCTVADETGDDSHE